MIFFFFYRNKQYDFDSFMHSIHSINLAIFFCVMSVKEIDYILQ